MTTTIIFLCPHASAKSVVAAALLGREADHRGLDVEISNAGTDPDEYLNPTVVELLRAERLTPAGLPRRVTEADLDAADVIVNIGCDPRDLPTRKSVRDWEIPNFSDGPAMAFAALQAHVADLAKQLSR